MTREQGRSRLEKRKSVRQVHENRPPHFAGRYFLSEELGLEKLGDQKENDLSFQRGGDGDDSNAIN